MPHTTRLLALQRRRLAGYREQHVASCELETCGARGDRRLHSRRESAIVVRGSAGSLPAVVDSLPTTFFPTSCRKAEAGTLSSQKAGIALRLQIFQLNRVATFSL